MARLGDGRLRLLPAGVATPACCSRAIPSATCWRRWPSSIITPLFGWRGLFFFGAVPGLVAVFIRMRVQESEAWEETKRRERETRVGFREVFLQPKVLRRFVYLVLLMGAFNFMSHGTQDFFPTFLEDDFNATTTTTTIVAIIYNIGAIFGGAYFGAFSERFGRRRTLILCAPDRAADRAAVLLRAVAGADHARRVLMQIFVQGAWGVIPAHLTELSPDAVRGAVRPRRGPRAARPESWRAKARASRM